MPDVRIRIDEPKKAAIGCSLILALLGLVVVGIVVAGRTLGDAVENALDRIQPAALIAAGVATVGFLAALGFVRWSRRPRRPLEVAVPANIARELPALRAEPPALAGFLAGGFEPRRESAPATLLDLAARGVVAIDGIGEGLRVRVLPPEADDHGDLLPHERRVLELVRHRAVHGSVPGAALTSGPREHAGAWWKGFRNEVIDQAQALGLSRDVWDRGTLLAFSVASLLPATLVLIGTKLWGVGVMYAVAALAYLQWIRERRAQRDTDAGLAAAGDWRAVRAYLGEAELEHLPPASVAVWERFFAYAAAFGVARAAIETIPMGAEEDHRAWSSHGGRWREVRIRYPLVWPPAWGWLPGVALPVSVLGIGAAAGLLRLATAIGWPRAGPGDPPGLVVIVRGIALAAGVAAVVIGVWSAITLVRSIADLGGTRTMTGQVLRVRTFGKSSKSPGRHYLAIDDGTADVIRAWRVPHGLWSSAPSSQYGTVTVSVWPRLGRIRSFGRSLVDR